jgi:hypothetical protein
MRKIVIAAMAAVSLVSLAACNKYGGGNGNTAENAAAPAAVGADAINGTWKADLSTVQMSGKPDQLLLKDGKFDCPTCTPPITLAADGAFHPVTGRAYADSMSIKVDDDHDVTRTDKKGGKVTFEGKYGVSGDGNTLTLDFTDSSTPNAPPTKGQFVETRSAPAPAGAHAISGTWTPKNYANINDEALTTTYRLEGDTLHMSSPSGQSYDAKLDGTATPIKGDIGGTTVSVKKVGDNSYEETDTRDGKVVSVATFMVGADGKLNVTFVDKRNDSTMKYMADKQ